MLGPSNDEDPYQPMFEDFSDRAKLAITEAEELAKRLGDKAAATGHLIYGLTKDRSGISHHLFMDLNIDPDMFSGYMQKLPREAATKDGSPHNKHLQTVFERAREVRKALSGSLVTPEHLLIALMSIKEGSCYETLKEFSVEPEDIRIECLESLGFEDEEAPHWS
jgi:ATP-dependent Clp protease ATP-binding subunit ClpC